MSVTRVLLDILIVLLVAKVAAELAERAKVPAVVGEIVAGILIGPSVLGLVGNHDDVLHVLGELGVILLLLDVGMEMDLGELAAVGRASLSVAVIGVAVPFALGWVVASALGMSGNEAMFVGAALTATSVGITARVFGDLRALATVEARTVLAAAVADDVIGLVILTVVVRLASEGSVSPLSVGAIVGVAVGFLAITCYCGVRVAPSLFAGVARLSRSSGTLVAVALAFTLAVAELASAARLAPIVGAFVAGIALSRCSVADRIRRELTPVGHLFIPVFFLSIGIDAQVDQFASGRVLGLAGALLVVAIVGKLCAAAGLWRAPGDRILVGFGMIPRGEVGLIFATIGLRENIFGQDVYAALLLVVLVTTLATPPLLRWRLLQLRKAPTGVTPTTAEPEGGWLKVAAGPGGGTVELEGEPSPSAALRIALEAALMGERHRPGPRLLEWLGRLPDVPMRWDVPTRGRFFALLEAGGPRAWRFLALTGVLERALPELGDALARRQADPFELDPSRAMQWPILTRLRELDRLASLPHPERVRLAGVILDATDGGSSAVAVARKVVQRVDLGAAAEQAVAGMVVDANLLAAAARRLGALEEEFVLQLAVHLRSLEQERAVVLLAEALDDLSPWERNRLHELDQALQVVLAHPELTGRAAANAVEQRRSQATRLTADPAVRDRIAAAPRAYLLATPPPVVAFHAALCEPLPGRDETRVRVNPIGPSPDRRRIDILSRDRVGLLAAETHVLTRAGVDVVDATVATWGDGCALACFTVSTPASADTLDVGQLDEALRAALRRAPSPIPVRDANLEFDDVASPWHTIGRVTAADRPGFLHAVTAAFAVAGASVHSARVTTVQGQAVDTFELTDRDGRKLDGALEEGIRQALTSGVTPGRRRRLQSRRPRRSARGETAQTHVKENRQELDEESQQVSDKEETAAQ